MVEADLGFGWPEDPVQKMVVEMDAGWYIVSRVP